MTGLVTLGETMLVLRSAEPSPLRWGMPYSAAMAGCESNVAIGVARLGHDAAWLGRVVTRLQTGRTVTRFAFDKYAGITRSRLSTLEYFHPAKIFALLERPVIGGTCCDH